MSSGFDWAGNLAKYSGNYNTSDLANNTFAGYGDNFSNIDYSLPTTTSSPDVMWGNSIFGQDNSGTNWGSLINTLGRLGSGVLGGMADYQSSANQQAYIPYTQWLGNGLAKFSAINNTGNKQQQQNNAYGNALMLSSLFGRGFGRNNDTIDALPRNIQAGV